MLRRLGRVSRFDPKTGATATRDRPAVTRDRRGTDVRHRSERSVAAGTRQPDVHDRVRRQSDAARRNLRTRWRQARASRARHRMARRLLEDLGQSEAANNPTGDGRLEPHGILALPGKRIVPRRRQRLEVRDNARSKRSRPLRIEWSMRRSRPARIRRFRWIRCRHRSPWRRMAAITSASCGIRFPWVRRTSTRFRLAAHRVSLQRLHPHRRSDLRPTAPASSRSRRTACSRRSTPTTGRAR